MKKEEFRTIEEAPNYEISKNAVVRRIDDGKILKQPIRTRNAEEDKAKGYKTVGIYIEDENGNLTKKTKYVHRLMYAAFKGELPTSRSMVIDHMDNNPQNNAISNLQLTTNRENCSKDIRKNRATSSRFVGVTLNRGKWYSRIKINGESIHLGVFECEYSAHKAYQSALKAI